MTNPLYLMTLAEHCTTAELFAELCKACGTDPTAEELAIVEALGWEYLPTPGTPAYWIWLGTEACHMQETRNRL